MPLERFANRSQSFFSWSRTRRRPSETAEPPDPIQERTQLRLRQLNRLIEMDMEYAEVLHDQRMQLAKAAATDADRVARALDRVNRSVRRHTVHVAMNEALNSDTVCPSAKIGRLSDDLHDWMDREPDDTFADDRPIAGILWRTGRDLGAPCDLGVWETEDWADDEVVYPPGSPYAAYRTTGPSKPASFGEPLWAEQPKAPPLNLPDNQPPQSHGRCEPV